MRDSHARRRITAGAFALALVAASVLGTGLAANASKPSPTDGEHKVGFCHATHSKKNPYVHIETDKTAVLRAHSKHQDLEDLWPSFWYVNDDGVEVLFPGSGRDGFIQNDCKDEGGNG